MPPYYDDFIGPTTVNDDKLIQEAKKEADKYIQRIMNITLSPAKQWINHNHNGIIVWADFPQAILLSKGIPFLTQNNAEYKYTKVYISGITDAANLQPGYSYMNSIIQQKIDLAISDATNEGSLAVNVNFDLDAYNSISGFTSNQKKCLQIVVEFNYSK